MLYLFFAAACILTILTGSLWLFLTAVTALVMVIYPSTLIFLGLLALMYFVLHYWNP